MFSKKTPRLEVIIGPETVFRGELTSKGTVRIDGGFEGNIFADCLIIGESGVLTGDVVAKDMNIGGKMTGNVRASGTVEIQPKGEVYGDISAASLAVSEGAVFEGRSSMQKNREIEYVPAGFPAS
jgi:cytoskeletal protein CcmA (bactofilin family)